MTQNPGPVAHGDRARTSGRRPAVTSWRALAVLMVGMLIVVVDTTVLNVALPAIAEDLGVSAGIEWVVTGYFLAVAVAQPVTGWISGWRGLKPTFVGALASFGAMAVVAASAPTFATLVPARALQGALGGLIIPISAAIVYEIVPRERRGTIVGISGAIVALGPAASPLLGGFLVGAAGWRWLVLATAAPAVLCAVAGVRHLPAVGVRERRPLDVIGLLLGAGGATALLVGLSQGDDWGWSAAPSVGALVAAPVLLGAFLCRLRLAAHPLVRPAIFREAPYTASLGIVWAASVAQFGSVVFVPVQLQVLRGMSPLEAGAVVASVAVAAAVCMPLAGRWTDVLGARSAVVSGAALLAAGALRLGTLELSTPVWQVVAALGVLGVGRVLVTVPATVEGLNVVADRHPEPLVTEAASIRALNRQLAGAVVTAGLAALVVARGGSLDPVAGDVGVLARAQAAYNTIFLVAIVGAVAAVVLSRYLLRSAPARGPSAEEVG